VKNYAAHIDRITDPREDLIKALSSYTGKRNSRTILSGATTFFFMSIFTAITAPDSARAIRPDGQESLRAPCICLRPLRPSEALELGKEGIRFNSILPGWTETERVSELMVFRAKQNGTTVEEEIAKIVAQWTGIPIFRLEQKEEIIQKAKKSLLGIEENSRPISFGLVGRLFRRVFA
jgi:ATP-dependent Clp protease ATP-binding subunit ClpA